MTAARRLGAVTLVVDDYDRAIAFYRDALGFALIEDTHFGCGKRWVLVAPSPDSQTRILLAEAKSDEERAAIGRQTGGRVGFFLETDDFSSDHARMTAAGVVFREAPRNEPYGTVAVFEDCFGNPWDLIEPKRP